ncbi:hypothetical protein [Chryseobacterium sp. HMWF035]|uniref:hypothetical protein n=1 Tax=Chryseobacterium sp. HMWF035 TaxID=2056868 RepID=UPI000D579D8E|nr:hypothetical protein [Chryseobacterium sp. HMWF035]PVV59775.1 hypothetical protein DD829_05575 [Chryseobacterium sp. HMWF035]
MNDQFLEIKTYIDNISSYDSSESFEYDHFPYLKNILDHFTAKQQDDFIEEVFKWEDHQLYFFADFLDFTQFILKGKYNSSYVFCECFSKINNVEYLRYIYINLEMYLMRRKFFNDDLILSVDDIVNNLYLLINHLRDENSIDFCLKMIENLKH